MTTIAMNLEALVILLLVAFIVGVILGVSMTRPVIR